MFKSKPLLDTGLVHLACCVSHTVLQHALSNCQLFVCSNYTRKRATRQAPPQFDHQTYGHSKAYSYTSRPLPPNYDMYPVTTNTTLPPSTLHHTAARYPYSSLDTSSTAYNTVNTVNHQRVSSRDRDHIYESAIVTATDDVAVENGVSERQYFDLDPNYTRTHQS